LTRVRRFHFLYGLARTRRTWNVTGTSVADVTVWIKLSIKNLLALSAILSFFAVFFLRVTPGCIQRSGIPTVDRDALGGGLISNLMWEGSIVNMPSVVLTRIVAVLGVAAIAIYI